MAEELLQLSRHDRLAIKALIDDIHAQFGQNIIQLIFFGSKARGDEVADSDIDLLLVTDREDWEFRHQVLRRGAPIPGI
ncbi:MAG: nucleotidyltransferase domain-containing protein [Chloroflexi bacterium]|nr:nucleotidyltransferase domain-containing protein [Chloroflexota bacterium]